MLGQFSHDSKVVQAVTVTAGAAGTTAINSTAIDMSGFGGVCFIVQFGAIVAGAATSLKAQQDTTAAMSTAADIAGSNQTILDTDDDKVFYLDIRSPQKDFVRLVISRATQNATCSAIAVLYRARVHPVTHGTGVAGTRFIAPAEGTP